MRHFASPDFWHHYRQLPEHVRELADKNFVLLKANSRHPSIRLKKAGPFWSARVGSGYRTLGKDRPEGIVWFWTAPTPNTTSCSRSNPLSVILHPGERVSYDAYAKAHLLMIFQELK